MENQNQVVSFKPQTVRSEVLSQMESMSASKFINLPQSYKESVFFAMEKLSSLQDIEKVPAISVTKALIKMFSNKLDFQKNHCYFFVQNDKNSATGKSLRFGWQYQGLISVAKEDCGVQDIIPVLINEDDTYEMEYVSGVLVISNHKPTFTGAITGGYCMVIFKGGEVRARYYTRAELDKRRDKSMAKNGQFWSWEREMYEKTVVNATLKRLIETHSETNTEELYTEYENVETNNRESVETKILIQNEPIQEEEKVQI